MAGDLERCSGPRRRILMARDILAMVVLLQHQYASTVFSFSLFATIFGGLFATMVDLSLFSTSTTHFPGLQQETLC